MTVSEKLELVRSIAHAPLSSHAKNFGTVVALAVIEERGYARLRRYTVEARTGLKGRTLDRAIAEFEASGLMERVRTGRATIWRVRLKSSRYSGFATYGETDAPHMTERRMAGDTDSAGEARCKGGILG
jgi:hypothetical protein